MSDNFLSLSMDDNMSPSFLFITLNIPHLQTKPQQPQMDRGPR